MVLTDISLHGQNGYERDLGEINLSISAALHKGKSSGTNQIVWASLLVVFNFPFFSKRFSNC